MAIAQRIENVEYDPYLSKPRRYAPNELREVEEKFEARVAIFCVGVIWLGLLTAIMRLLFAFL